MGVVRVNIYIQDSKCYIFAIFHDIIKLSTRNLPWLLIKWIFQSIHNKFGIFQKRFFRSKAIKYNSLAVFETLTEIMRDFLQNQCFLTWSFCILFRYTLNYHNFFLYYTLNYHNFFLTVYFHQFQSELVFISNTSQQTWVTEKMIFKKKKTKQQSCLEYLLRRKRILKI